MNQQRHARCPSSTTNETLTSPPPTSIPSDLVVEILCRLPVKFLLQFRSVCKFWNSLISDSKFANKHLHQSTTHRINSVYYSYFLRRHVFESYPLDSIFSNIYTNATQLECPPNSFDVDYYPLERAFDRLYSIVACFNGIVCLAYSYDCFVLVWNPSTGKFKELPYPDKPKFYYITILSYGFGYDNVNDNYKVVVVFPYSVDKTHVMVHTLGTNFWKSVEKFPFGCDPLGRSGTFVSGTINWLPFKDKRVMSFIVSFDLRTESYRKILQPDYGEFVPEAELLSLGVLRECLCLISYHSVWIMKEFGNKDSWTKIFTNTYNSCFCLTKAIYMFEDDQLLLEASYSRVNKKLILHDPKTGTTKFINFKNKSTLDSSPEVCVESLISPWS
ncbi:F-box/kelch-repeat protein At3g23880-like [Vicia villosa]|uniref:F-box/kelch-repeat protein At3g23880-like n=1 Tax=Vicia villosa TaxID=3911 RepID=UPI00273CF2F3|nr:F-box/kelch-repeat protein At3g23880-like [Vicia villosa]